MCFEKGAKWATEIQEYTKNKKNKNPKKIFANARRMVMTGTWFITFGISWTISIKSEKPKSEDREINKKETEP